MILGNSELLEDKIVRILGRQGARTEIEIQSFLKNENSNPTPQGVYRSLRKLKNEGVIVQEGTAYGLRIAWIKDLAGLVRSMERSLLFDAYLQRLIPKTAGKRVWHFTDLHKANSFWSQLLMAMVSVGDNPIVLNYVPHLWFQVLDDTKEEQFVRAFMANIRRDYIVVGSRSPIDRLIVPLLTAHEKEQIYLADETEYLDKKRRVYVSIVDDLICTMYLDPAMTTEIDRLFENTIKHQSLETIASEIKGTLEKRGRHKIILRRDRAAATRYYKKFQRLFGPL